MKKRVRLNPRKIMSQRELADYLGVHYTTIGRWIKELNPDYLWQYSPSLFLSVYDQLKERLK